MVNPHPGYRYPPTVECVLSLSIMHFVISLYRSSQLQLLRKPFHKILSLNDGGRFYRTLQKISASSVQDCNVASNVRPLHCGTVPARDHFRWTFWKSLMHDNNRRNAQRLNPCFSSRFLGILADSCRIYWTSRWMFSWFHDPGQRLTQR